MSLFFFCFIYTPGWCNLSVGEDISMLVTCVSNLCFYFDFTVLESFSMLLTQVRELGAFLRTTILG